MNPSEKVKHFETEKEAQQFDKMFRKRTVIVNTDTENQEYEKLSQNELKSKEEKCLNALKKFIKSK